jgi:hypothetical protein
VNKTTLIHDFIIDNHIDLTVITETWLNAKDGIYHTTLNELCPDGYKIISKPRDKRGGGVAVILKATLNTETLEVKSAATATSYEHITITVSNNSVAGNRYIFVAVYRPPAKTLSNFIDEIQLHLSEVRLHQGSLIVCGDFNIHLEKTTAPSCKKLHDVFDSHGLQLNTTPSTHVKGHTLDAVVSENPLKVKVVDNAISDHFTLTYHLRRSAIPSTRPPVDRYYNTGHFSKVLIDDFCSETYSLVYNTVLPSGSTDSKCDRLLSGFIKILDSHAPVARKRHRPRKFKYSAEIAEAKRLSRKLERRYITSKLFVDREILDKQNKVVANIVKTHKSAYYCNLIQNSANTPKSLFKVFTQLTTDANPLLPTAVKNPEEAFASYFSDKVKTIIATFPAITRRQHNSIFDNFQFDSFVSVTSDDLKKIDIKCSSVDPAPTGFMKRILPALLPAITDLVNISFRDGQFPNAFKSAILIPIIKDRGADVNQLKNYRPVSLLSFISKIIEKVASIQLTNYMKKNHLGNQRQSAYKAAHSVETTLLALQSELLEVLDRGKAAFLVLLDLSAAFDTVNHDLLLDLLNTNFDVTGKALRWFSSYLSGRTFRVKIGDILSNSRQLSTGVPQGSVLGPLLFNAFTSGLASIFSSSGVSAYYYADDTQFYVEFDPKSKESEMKARGLVKDLFKKLSEWMLAHHLKLNEEKTMFLPICRDERQFNPLHIGSNHINPSNSLRNLGFIFNQTLSISDHINYLKQSTFYHLRRINSIRNCVSFQCREILVHAFITSRLDFCNSLFYGSSQQQIKSINSILTSAAKSLCGVSRRAESLPILRRLHWLPVEKRILFKLAIYGFKILHQTAPEYFNPIGVAAPARATRSALAPCLTSSMFLNTSRLVKYGDRCAFYSVCCVFNSLPAEVRVLTNFNAFKSKLKTYLFSQ